MTSTTDTELKEILNRIDKLDQKLEEKIDKLDQKLEEKIDKLDQKLEEKLDKIVTRVESLEVGQVRIDEKLSAVNQRLDDIKQQTDKQDIRLGVMISGLFIALFGAIAKV